MEQKVSGPRVLVVEDEYFIADEIANALLDHGATIVGPVATPDDALRAVEEDGFDVAVLDLNLDGKVNFSLADEMMRRNVRFAFATGYDAGIIPARFAHIRRFEKPFNTADLASYLAEISRETR